MTTTLDFMTYEQWVKRNQDLINAIEDCEECDGEGTHECECGDVHDCGFCIGTGKKNNPLELYQAQKKKDQEKLAVWLEKSATDEHTN